MHTTHADDAGALDFEAFNRVETPSRGLPPFAYTSDDFWRRECGVLFPNSWVFAGFAHELATTGDARPVTVAGQPILLVRNREGAIRAFHNVCRHRGVQLVAAPANVGRMIRCPYHSWVYGLDGDLRSTPCFGGAKSHDVEGFDRGEHGLVPVRMAIWHDWIFVNLSGDAEDFDAFIAPLAGRLDGLDLDRLTPVGIVDFGEIATNWKFLMENFIEPYHVQFVHRTTTEQPLSDHSTFIDGGCVGSAVDISRQGQGANTLAVSSRYLTLFPNFVLGRYFPDQLGVHQNIPVGPGRTCQRRAIYMTDGSNPTEQQVAALKDLWTRVHREDHEICERLQAGRASGALADGGVLSPYWEDSVRRFQEFVAAAVS